MATRDKTSRRQGPLAADNSRLRNFWNRDENSSSTSTHSSNHQTKIEGDEDPQSETSQQEKPRLRRWSRVFYDQASTREPGPSPSVEPPQISVYKLGPSPSPAYYIYGHDAFDPPYQLDGASMPPPQTLRVDSLPLEGIAETESSIGQQDGVSASHGAKIATSGNQIRMDASTSKLPPSNTHSNPEARRLRRKPIKKPLHPDGDSITPQFGQFKPPEDIVNHAEITRHGSLSQGAFDVLSAEEEAPPALGEAEYQHAITPPITQREAPPAIILDPAAFEPVIGPASSSLTRDVDVQTNTVTWVSTPKTTTGLVPPVSQIPMSSPNVTQSPESFESPSKLQGQQANMGARNLGHYDTTKPTCSLNLVCYRSGAKGCDLQQLHCILRSRFPSSDGFQVIINANQHLLYDDEQFFKAMRSSFDVHMSGFMRRWFSLKSHKAFRILAYTPTTRPVVVPFDDFVLQEMMFAYMNPSKVESTDDWIQWVFRLRRRDKRHAVEFVEGWNSNRIAIAGTIPWLSSCIVGIAWTAAGGDVQSAFTVASFILTSSSIMLALLAVISSIESSGRTVM